MPAPSTFAKKVAAIAEEQHQQCHLQHESDSVGMKIVRLTATGFIKQRATNPYICVIQNLK